jgi:hypothetical protein
MDSPVAAPVDALDDLEQGVLRSSRTSAVSLFREHVRV